MEGNITLIYLSYLGSGLLALACVIFGPFMLGYSGAMLEWWCRKKSIIKPHDNFGIYWLGGFIIILGLGLAYGIGVFIQTQIMHHN